MLSWSTHGKNLYCQKLRSSGCITIITIFQFHGNRLQANEQNKLIYSRLISFSNLMTHYSFKVELRINRYVKDWLNEQMNDYSSRYQPLQIKSLLYVIDWSIIPFFMRLYTNNINYPFSPKIYKYKFSFFFVRDE